MVVCEWCRAFLSGRGCVLIYLFFFFQAEDGIRDLVRSRGLGDVYKRQGKDTRGILRVHQFDKVEMFVFCKPEDAADQHAQPVSYTHLTLPTIYSV